MNITLNVSVQEEEARKLFDERKRKYEAINGALTLMGEFFPGYAAIIDFKEEVVHVTKGFPNEVVANISVWGDNPKACLMDTMKGLIPLMEKELR
jgi:hypothetical protein